MYAGHGNWKWSIFIREKPSQLSPVFSQFLPSDPFSISDFRIECLLFPYKWMSFGVHKKAPGSRGEESRSVLWLIALLTSFLSQLIDLFVIIFQVWPWIKFLLCRRRSGLLEREARVTDWLARSRKEEQGNAAKITVRNRGLVRLPGFGGGIFGAWHTFGHKIAGH